jgi:hypothetical protein
VDTVIDAPSSVSWTVNLYFNSQLEQTYQGSGSQSYTWDAPYGASGTVSYQASAPNTCTVSYSPSQSFTITPGNTYTETITITCQGQQPPPPPPMCYFSYSAATVPPGLNAKLQFTGPSSLNPGQSGGLSGSAPKYATDSQNDNYEFEEWVIGSNPNGYADATIQQATFYNGWIPSCPSNLTSSVNVQVLGHAEYQFIGCASYYVGINLTTSGEAILSWKWCPLDPAVSWSGSGGASGNAIYASGQVTSELGVTRGASSQQVPVCGTGQKAVYEGVSPSSGSINDQASGSVTFQVEFTCQSTGGGGGGKGP